MMKSALLCGVLTLGVGCANASNPDEELGPGDVPMAHLTDIGPGALALGDSLHVLGRNLPTDSSRVTLELRGAFEGDDGMEYPVEVDLDVSIQSAVHGEVIVETVPFGPGDRIGRFAGDAVLRVDSLAGTYRSDPIDSELRILPSIRVERLTAAGRAGCPSVIARTNGDTVLDLRLTALGVPDASAARPMQFELTFASPALRAVFVPREVLSMWPQIVDPSLEIPSPDGQHSLRFDVSSGTTLQLASDQRPAPVRVTPPLPGPMGSDGEPHLARIATGPVGDFASESVVILVRAQAADGSVLDRVLTLEAHAPLSIGKYDGATRMVERYAAQQVCGCVSGGELGRELAYNEGQSESRTRSVGFRWDANVASTLGLTLGLFNPVVQGTAQQTWSETFGVDVSQSVTSETHQSVNLSAQIVPGWFGVCYRQTERLSRTASLVYHGACGEKATVGEVELTDWTWGFDIASGPTCPPPSNLPPAAVNE